MQKPIKASLISIIQVIPLLLVAIGLLILPFFLLETHHQSVNHHTSTSNYRFSSEQIVSPISQNQNLKYVTLPNSIQALLVNDPDLPKSGCAVKVQAGSTDEPNEIHGLAHFLEHMLYQGSKKYPTHDYFDDFLSRNDGNTNAFTADTFTAFYFDVDNPAFNDGVDIFSHFFVDARLDPSAIEQEIHAVDNEYEIDLQKNGWRFVEVVKKLAKRDNPYHRFTIGNIKTLKTIPESQNISLYQELRQFYENYYTPDKISVVLISNQPLDQLEKLVREKFSLVPRRNELNIEGKNASQQQSFKQKEKLDELWNFLHLNMKNSKNSRKPDENLMNDKQILVKHEEKHWNFLNLHQESRFERSSSKSKKEYPSAFTPDDLGKYVWYKTLGNAQELTINFVLNSTMDEDPFTKSWDYLTELINNDYASGFKNYLINKNWISWMDAGINPGVYGFFMFQIKFGLTSDGFNAIPDLINNFFALIGMIANQGVSQSIYNEKSLISYINFLYGQKEGLDDELNDLILKVGIDLKDIFVNGAVYMKYDEAVIRYWVSKLQPSNALFIIGSGDFQNNDLIEKIAFKRKGINFKENSESAVKEWEPYDDFMKEIHEDVGTYRLKTGEKKSEVSKTSNDPEIMRILKKNWEKTKSPQLLINSILSKTVLCRKIHKHRRTTNSRRKQSNDTSAPDKSNFNTWLYSKKLNKFDELMKIYYRVEPVDPTQLLSFASFISSYSSILPPDLTLYQTNPYIPTDLSMADNKCVANGPLPKSQAFQQRILEISNFTDPINSLIHSHIKEENDGSESKINETCYENEINNDKEFSLPESLVKNKGIEAWVKPSREFNLPKVRVNIIYHYPNCGFESFMLDLLTAKLKMNLDSNLTNARPLGYNIDINKEGVGIKVTIDGFHDKIEDLVSFFSDNFFALTLEESEYEGLRTLTLLQDIFADANVQFGDMSGIPQQDEAIQQAELTLRVALGGWDLKSYSSYLRTSDYSVFKESVARFRRNARIKVLFFGNILENEASRLLNLISRGFSHSDSGEIQEKMNLSCIFTNSRNVLKLPTDTGLVFRAPNLNADDVNHAIINYYQLGIEDTHSALKMKAFSQTFNLKSFDYLRTLNQLGYIVVAQPIYMGHVLGIAVFIQGSVKNPKEMDGMIEDFLRYFEEYLYNLDDSFMQQELTNMQYDIFEYRKKGFYQKSEAYWGEIFEGVYNFDKKDVKEVMNGLSKMEILDFYRNLMKNNQRKLSIQVWGGNMTIPNDLLESVRNYGGKSERIVDNFFNMDKYVVGDNKLRFYEDK